MISAVTYGKAVFVFALTSGVAHYAVDQLVDTTFVRSLIIAVVTGAVAGAFAIVAAKIQAQSDRETHSRLDALEQRAKDVAGAVGANKRDTDTGNGDQAH